MTPITFNAHDNSYIDHELSVNLDSTEAFEGPEKLLEIWFFNSVDEVPDKSRTLRSISHEDWSGLLDLVNCKILSIKSTDKLDAFLLSESSLFVFDHKLILKTCGTTTTLNCLNALFRLVQHKLNWDFLKTKELQPSKVFYSRRSFMFPNQQKSIYKNWDDEVKYLNNFFTNATHYLIGRIDNKHWHLYTTESNTTRSIAENDQTFEILMTEISRDKAEQFVTSRKPGFEIDSSTDLGHFIGESTSNNTGLNNLYGKVQVNDAFSFTPCGFSSNSILNEDSYYTIHVTPERDWSYASFETNVNPQMYNLTNVDVLFKVLRIFKPHSFQFTFFANESNENFKLLKHLDEIRGYKKLDKIIYDLDGYELLYVRYQVDDEELLNQLVIDN